MDTVAEVLTAEDLSAFWRSKIFDPNITGHLAYLRKSLEIEEQVPIDIFKKLFLSGNDVAVGYLIRIFTNILSSPTAANCYIVDLRHYVRDQIMRFTEPDELRRFIPLLDRMMQEKRCRKSDVIFKCLDKLIYVPFDDDTLHSVLCVSKDFTRWFVCVKPEYLSKVFSFFGHRNIRIRKLMLAYLNDLLDCNPNDYELTLACGHKCEMYFLRFQILTFEDIYAWVHEIYCYWKRLPSEAKYIPKLVAASNMKYLWKYILCRVKESFLFNFVISLLDSHTAFMTDKDRITSILYAFIYLENEGITLYRDYVVHIVNQCKCLMSLHKSSATDEEYFATLTSLYEESREISAFIDSRVGKLNPSKSLKLLSDLFILPC